MMTFSIVMEMGAFVRWILKGRKTKLQDEIDGLMEPKWGFTYRFENLIIGSIVNAIFLSIIIILVCVGIIR